MPWDSGQKVYVHVSGRTVVFRDVSLDATVDHICALWAARIGQNQATACVRASTVKGRPLQGWQLISKALGPSLELCLALTPQQECEDAVEEGNEHPSDDLRSAQTSQAESHEGGRHVLEPPPSKASTSPLIAPLLERATEKEASQHYKSAAFIYEQVGMPELCTAIFECSVCCIFEVKVDFSPEYSKVSVILRETSVP